MAKQVGIVVPHNIPERLSFNDNNGKICEFDIEFIIFANGKSLIATEVGVTNRKAKVWGGLDDDFDEMLDTLKKRIKRELLVKYMRPDGLFADNKVVGYIEYNQERGAHDIIIDGKPYTWAMLEQNISTFEGYKIKIEFAGIEEELD